MNSPPSGTACALLPAAMLAGVFALLTAGCVSPAAGTARSGSLNANEALLLEGISHYVCGMILEATSTNALEAAAQFESVTDADPQRTDLIMKVAKAYHDAGQAQKALHVLEKGCAANPDDARLRLFLAYSYHVADRKEDALAGYTALFRQAPELAAGYLGATQMYLALDRERMALRTLDVGLRKTSCDDELVHASLRIADAFAAASQWARSARFLAVLSRRLPDDTRVAVRLHRALVESGHPDRAARALASFGASGTNEQRRVKTLVVCTFLADEYAKDRKWTLATACLDELVKRGWHDSGTAIRLFEAHLRNNEKDRAMRALDLIPEEERADPKLKYIAGSQLLISEDYPEAARFFDEADALQEKKGGTNDFRNATFRYLQGMARERTGRYAEAEASFEKCIALDESHAEALNYLAYMWAERGTNLVKAAEYVRRSLDRDPDNAAYIDTLGWIYYREGKFRLACETLGKALSITPEEPVITDHMGDVLNALNQPYRAMEHWKRSYILDPTNGEVSRKLQEYGVDPAKLAEEAKTVKKPEPGGNAEAQGAGNE